MAYQSLGADFDVLNANWLNFAYQGRLLPEITDVVYCSFGKNNIMSFLEYYSSTNRVRKENFSHIEENKQECKLITTAEVAYVPDTSFDIPVSTVTPGVIPVSVGEVVYVPSPTGTQVALTVLAINTATSTITVTPYDNIPAFTIPSGSAVLFFGGHLQANCGCQDCKFKMPSPGVEVVGNMANIKNCFKICVDDAAQFHTSLLIPKTVLDPSNPCKTLDCVYFAGQRQMYQDFHNAKSAFALLGVHNNSTNPTVQVQGSLQGFLPTLRSRAKQSTWNDTTDWAVWLDDLTCEIKAERGFCNSWQWWVGCNLRQVLHKYVRENYGCGSLNYGSLSCSTETIIKNGFEGFCWNGVYFYLQDENTFNDNCLLGAEGYNGKDIGVMIPNCNVECGGQMTTPVTTMYLEGCGGINTEFVENDYGFLKPGSMESNCRNHTWEVSSKFGFQYKCIERLRYISKV